MGSYEEDEYNREQEYIKAEETRPELILKKLWENRYEPDKLYLIFDRYKKEIEKII